MNAADLDAILQEARSCFLYEDAPDYLAALEQGMQRLLVAAENPQEADHTKSGLQGEYATLMRAAHSLKGGAGIAQLPSLQQLAHKLEDLLQALEQGRVQTWESAYELIFLGVEQVKDLIAEALSNPSNAVTTKLAASLPIVQAIDSFLQELPKESNLDNSLEGLQASAISPYMLKTALEVDLEECLQRIEELLQPPVRLQAIEPALTNLVEECTLLGQALNLNWLLETAETVRQALAQKNSPVETIATTAIAKMRQLRTQTLSPLDKQGSRGDSGTPVPKELGIRGREAQGSKEISIVTEVAEVEAVTLAKAQVAPESAAPPQETQTTQVTPVLNLRIPVSRLDRMNNTLGELLISHERLSLYQSQLYQANSTLNKEAQKLNPINEQVRVFYDQLATPIASLGTATTDLLAFGTANSEFDPLQFDRYSTFHGTLQDFQEVMVRVQETRSDIDLLSRDLQEALDQLRQQLNILRHDLTESRLVPFRFLAERFVAPLQNLNQRYQKSAELAIVGKETLIDQVILEQLQTPLTHLLRNAFDHGIETPEERLGLGKPNTAQITLSATVQENQVAIAIADDGRGIDLQKVYQRAEQMGLCSADTAAPTEEQILEFLFMPGFSTATAVTDLSGRGVGLDAVRLQVERLRGSIQVETKLPQGTKFTITIPLTLSILPLLLCRCQQRTLAIPSSNVREVIAISDCNSSSQADTVIWQNRRVPLFSLTQLLPYTQPESVPSLSPTQQNLGIVLDINGEVVVVAVDSLLGERELVLKPFDLTVKVPAYVAGCTVLGTGEVVPVLSPHYFAELITQTQQISPTLTETGRQKSRQDVDAKEVPTILIVDDSVAVRRLLDRLLNQAGYYVVQCRDGQEALEALNRSGEHYALALSDIEMPRLDGFSLLKEIRSHPRWHSLPIAMLTSRENENHRQKAKNLGATAYFTKPFQATELLSAIAALIK